MCDHVKLDGTFCKNPGYCSIHAPLHTKKRHRFDDGKLTSSALNTAINLGTFIATVMALVLSLTHNPVQPPMVAYYSPVTRNPADNIAATSATGLSNPLSDLVTVPSGIVSGPLGGSPLASMAVTPPLVSSLSLQENFSPSDNITAGVTAASPKLSLGSEYAQLGASNPVLNPTLATLPSIGAGQPLAPITENSKASQASWSSMPTLNPVAYEADPKFAYLSPQPPLSSSIATINNMTTGNPPLNSVSLPKVSLPSWVVLPSSNQAPTSGVIQQACVVTASCFQ